MRTPGYPMFVGLLVGVFGLPLGAVYVLQALADTATTLLVAGVGWGMGGRKAGIGSAFVQALNPFSAVFAAQIMSESVVTLVMMGAVYLLFYLTLPSPPFSAKAWVAVGLLLGFATLVRPVFALIPAAFAVALFHRSRWREQLRIWILAAAGFGAVVGPWVGRNWAVARTGRADDSFQVLASFAFPIYRNLMTPGLIHWYKSFEEPFIWDRLPEAPAMAKYFLPGEKERTDELFAGMRAADLVVTPELDAAFERLARERIAAHPFRTQVIPAPSRAARLWITPRLSAFGVESARLPGFVGRLILLVTVAFNGTLALFGFVTGFALWRSTAARLLLVVPVYLTVIHSIIMWGNQSRYVVPAFPEIAILATLGGLALVAHIRRRGWRGQQQSRKSARAELV
ncbi:MAG TPA: glycosyltransferase family 39 protein [Polyangiaceae bacterium]|nr:glycosyltransferase family 39 protein [Polyangiaceae bacterium]